MSTFNENQVRRGQPDNKGQFAEKQQSAPVTGLLPGDDGTRQTKTACGLDVGYDKQTGLVYPLSPCCGASGKGSEDGVVCRNCYELLDELFGAAADINDHDAIEDWVRDRGCNVPADCATHTIYQLSFDSV
jgi:hypothetical protein